MTGKGDINDPKGLIYEAYRIEGITAAECRSIFLDWALSLPDGRDPILVLPQLIAAYGADQPDHPMTHVLQEGQGAGQKPRRRGGWKSRPRKGERRQ